MIQEMKRMTLGKKFWEKGYKENLSVQANGALSVAPGKVRGSFFSTVIDTLENDMTYRRLSLGADFTDESKVEVKVRISNDPRILYENSWIALDSVLQDEQISSEKKLAFFDQQEGQADGRKHTDILLHGLVGRYVWIYIGVMDLQGGQVSLNRVHMEFPDHSFTQYLPEVYQEQDFFKRYLGIFQSLYLDMERKIDKMPQFLDPDSVSGEFLDVLASWLGIHNEGQILSTLQLRTVVKNAIRMNRMKGTLQSLVEMVKLYTGVTPYVVEYFHLQKYTRANTQRQQLYNKLYADHPNGFCLLLPLNSVGQEKNMARLMRLTDKVRPAHSVLRIIELEPHVRLDMHSYLGINSELTAPTPGVIDHRGRLTGNVFMR